MLRLATLDDRAAIGELIALSARGLSREDYTDEQIAKAIVHVFGVDSDLIRDGTYFVVEEDGTLVGCGGWSRRATTFGGDQFPDRPSTLLDPARDAARIRAFFVHPDHARKGIGRTILDRCESAAREAGFRQLTLVATLPGLKLYRALGYESGKPIQYDMGGVPIDFVEMHKRI